MTRQLLQISLIGIYLAQCARMDTSQRLLADEPRAESAWTEFQKTYGGLGLKLKEFKTLYKWPQREALEKGNSPEDIVALFRQTSAHSSSEEDDSDRQAVPGNASENCNDECCRAVPNSVTRERYHMYSKICKCPRSHPLMTGPAKLCATMSRKFKPADLAEKGCSCQSGVQETSDKYDFETWKWMEEVDDEVRLNDLTIPGTHDTMAYQFKSGERSNKTGMTITHGDDLKMQLNRGIRWLDVRIGLSRGNVVTCHGPFEMMCDFACVLDQVSRFLAGNPSEAVFVMLKKECGDDCFEGDCDTNMLSRRVVSMLQGYPEQVGKSGFVLQGPAILDKVLQGPSATYKMPPEFLPCLPENRLQHWTKCAHGEGPQMLASTPLKYVRGQIVIVDTETWDVLPGFKEEATSNRIAFVPVKGALTTNSEGPGAEDGPDIQNEYKLGLMTGRKDKVNAVTAFLRDCSKERVREDSMRVNYFSASGVGYNVLKTASVTNAEVLETLQKGIREDAGQAFGACLLDGLPARGPVLELIRELIQRNMDERTAASLNTFAASQYQAKAQLLLKKAGRVGAFRKAEA